MNFKQLALEITKREGKKKQVDIAQVSEVLARLVDIWAERPAPVFALFNEQAELTITTIWAKKPAKRKGNKK